MLTFRLHWHYLPGITRHLNFVILIFNLFIVQDYMYISGVNLEIILRSGDCMAIHIMKDKFLTLLLLKI